MFGPGTSALNDASAPGLSKPHLLLHYSGGGQELWMVLQSRRELPRHPSFPVIRLDVPHLNLPMPISLTTN